MKVLLLSGRCLDLQVKSTYFIRYIKECVADLVATESDTISVTLFLDTQEFEAHRTLADYNITEHNAQITATVRIEEMPELVSSSDSENP